MGAAVPGDNDGRHLAFINDGQQVLRMVDHRPSRRGVERAAVPAAVVSDDMAIDKVTAYTPEAGRPIRRAVNEDKCWA
jgi:hypothetical protein